MRLYEVDITSLWYFAADDEMEAISMLKEEMLVAEVSEEDLDAIMDDLIVKEMSQEEAEMISAIDDMGEEIDSVWDLFIVESEPCLLYTDHHWVPMDGVSDEDLLYEEDFYDDELM